MPNPQTTWHGFGDWLTFVRATLALLVPILGCMWTMGSWGVGYLEEQADQRYVQHADLKAAVQDIKQAVKESVVDLKCQSLLEDMSRLEQTIRYKRSKGEDLGLEIDLLAADQRLLNQLSGCVRP